MEENTLLAEEHQTRHLRWDTCYNVRDIGGYDTPDGGRTRWGALLRADNLCRLTSAGQAALVAHGVRTIIDLRSPSEQQFPHPFANTTAHDGLLTYLALPLLDEQDGAGMAAINADPSPRNLYTVIVDRYATRVARAIMAVADAREGGVLVHCHAGKDRTGVVVALLLALAGVPAGAIAADYALSDTLLQPLYGTPEAAGGPAPIRQNTVAGQLSSPPEAMLATLAHIDDRYGGVVPYLRTAGVTDEQIERVRRRLLA